MTTNRKKTTRRGRPATRHTATRTTARRPIVEAVTTGRNLWLAGLGLAGTAVETATGAFDTLVAKGRRQEPKTIAAANRVLRRARAKASSVAAEATELSKKTVNGALDALGVDNRPRQKNVFHRLGDFAEALL